VRGDSIRYYVLQASDQSAYGEQRTAQEVFDFLVKGKSAWGFGYHTANRKAIQPGDKVLFYLTGVQLFVGAATLKSGAYKDDSAESKDWYLEPETLRIDLSDVVVFSEPRPRANFKNLEWRPAQGGSAKLSERDYLIVLRAQPDVPAVPIAPVEEMEFALEKYLEDFIVDNWQKIDFGEKLTLYEDDDGNDGQQYLAGDAGYIDILARDEKRDLVVVELKKGRKNDEVIGQVLRYMGWVRENVAKGAGVRGLVIVRERGPKLDYALREISDKVKIKRYNVSFKLVEY
jgi:predicted RNA-binding protein with PUA-like domain